MPMCIYTDINCMLCKQQVFNQSLALKKNICQPCSTLQMLAGQVHSLPLRFPAQIQTFSLDTVFCIQKHAYQKTFLDTLKQLIILPHTHSEGCSVATTYLLKITCSSQTPLKLRSLHPLHLLFIYCPELNF